MAKVGILTEKNSAARNFAKALGGSSGTFDGVEFVIVAARGHLLELADPADMVGPDLKTRFKTWALDYLPWDEKAIRWRREVSKGSSSVLANISKELLKCSEVVIASDIDPTGEGDLLAWEIVDHLDLHDKKITRMEFTDEAAPSLQKAFKARRAVKSMNDEGNFRKADFRSKFDMLSMQWTRIATKVAGDCGYNAVLRNGRLKSAMNVIVGDGLDAHNNYVKKPFFENRFRDELGVVYSDPEIDRFEKEADVPGGLKSSTVTNDGVTRKKTAPPKLLELSGLSALLAKEGFSARDVLATYQKMYEAQVVSYPRTEDKFVTPEQFKELEPKIDAIAAVVGVDPAALTHRSPRKTHVKNGGAHGANRPGPAVPKSLSAVESSYGKLGRRIYEVLARNYLRMLGGDYLYDQHKGHVTDYPSFVGSVNVMVDPGWKGIFDADADPEDGDDGDSKASGLGEKAEPFVHEGYPPRPPHPTMSWLMKQLEKRSIGTGATRTSTFSEITSGKTALMKESRGKITLSPMGDLNRHLLPGTHIGDLELTERVYADMAAIAAGELTIDDALAPVKDWVREDIAKIRENAKHLPANIGEGLMTNKGNKERFSGEFEGEQVSFAREVKGHRFSDEECATLLSGGKVRFKATGKDGSTYQSYGDLAKQSFVNDSGETVEYVGFRPLVDPEVYVEGDFRGEKIKFKRVWGGHKFSEAEIKSLLAGEEISFDATSKAGKNYTARGKLEKQSYNGNKFFGFKADFGKN